MTGLTGFLQAPLGIKDSSGNIVTSFISAPSSVNYMSIINESTGQNPGFIAVGTDTNVSVNIQAQAAGNVNTLSTSNIGLALITGTAYQHETIFNFANTANIRNVTWPDFDGTIVLASKANGTEAANAVTASGTTGVITTSALTTAGAANYAITWTNTFITTSSTVLLSIMGGTNTTNAVLLKATAGAGTSTLTIYNLTAATALNGNILIGYQVIP
jgi:hypothetical protein